MTRVVRQDVKVATKTQKVAHSETPLRYQSGFGN
jgi:hypothetical protein